MNGLPQKENLDKVAYTCMLSYPIVVSHLSFNFLCLLLLYSIYLCGNTHGAPAPLPALRDLTRDGRWSTYDVSVHKKMGGGGEDAHRQDTL